MDAVEQADTSHTDDADHSVPEISELPELPLKEALYLKDLPNGVEFEFKDPLVNKEDLAEEENYFATDDVLKNMNFECIDVGSSDEENDFRSPFQHIRAKMTPIISDKGVCKQIIKQGAGGPIPENSVVTIHYNSYLEYIEEPMDSTRLRNSPKSFRLGAGEVIRGLDIAVTSMKKGEISKFLIQPDYAFGARGCPPRIPPSATILYEVELIRIVDNADAYEFENLTPEERRLVPFSKVLAACKAENNSGNDLFRKNQIRAALKRYRKGVHLLENQHLKDEKEEEDYKHLLLKLYLNMSICYIKEQEAGKAIAFSKRALSIDGNNAKALFRCGKALAMQNDFTQARRYLIQAQRKEPNNPDITQELINLDKRKRDHMVLEREFCKRMFQNSLRTEDKKDES